MESPVKSHMSQHSNIRLRAILISLALAPINIYIVVQWETVWNTQYPTTMTIFYNVIFTFFFVVILNIPLKRWAPRVALSQQELLTIYTMLVMAVCVSGHDFSQALFCTLGTARWSATPENDWSNLFWKYLSPHLTVNDDRVLYGFYKGESTLYTPAHIKSWLEPMIWWTLFLTVVAFTMFCINVIIRKQWIEKEKLTYPLVQLPFEMSREGNGHHPFFRNKPFWIGLGLSAGVNLINGINYLFPLFPQIPLGHNLSVYFTERPFNAMDDFSIQFNPFAIGLAFAIPLDLLFSCWFFFLFWKAEQVVGSMAGINQPGYPFVAQQILGGYLGIAIVALWLARKPIWQLIKKVVRARSDEDDSREPMKYRTAVLGIILGISFLVFFSYQAGMTIRFALAFFGVYFAIAFAHTRARAELGPPMHGIHYFGPFQFFIAVIGSRKLANQTLTAAAPLWTFTKQFRNHPMPYILESFKLADRAGMDTRKLGRVIMLSVVVSLILTSWIFLQFSYKWGGISEGRGIQAYTTIERWLVRPIEPDIQSLGAIAVGSLFVFTNTTLRLRFLWWPLHPLAYPIAGYVDFRHLWFPFFISWLLKLVILKHGGIQAYRRTFPFFLGLVLGDFTIGSVWGIIGLITGEPTYAFKQW